MDSTGHRQVKPILGVPEPHTQSILWLGFPEKRQARRGGSLAPQAWCPLRGYLSSQVAGEDQALFRRLGSQSFEPLLWDSFDSD